MYDADGSGKPPSIDTNFKVKKPRNCPLLIPGEITLEEMEEVVGILYNLDGCEKVTL